MINKLDWDSDFFEITIGELFYENEFNVEQSNNFDLLYIKSNNDFELKIKNFKNQFSETKIIFSKQLDTKHTQQPFVFSCNKINYNLDELYDLAYESGKFSRFYLDKNFKIEKFQELYRKWVDNSISKIFADDVLIYQENKQTMGFVTYKIKDNFATIGLIAVSPNFQGKGIGGKLLNQVENLLLQQNIKKLLIPTQQQNVAACHFYKKQAYNVHETTFIKHYWKI